MIEELPAPAVPGSSLRMHKTYMHADQWRETKRRAAAAGMSVSAYLARLVERDQVDEQTGRPVWATEQGSEQLQLAS